MSRTLFMYTFLFWPLSGLMLIACLYYLFTLYAARRLFQRAPASSPSLSPPVSLLKPLKGAAADLYDQLSSFCRLQYPKFQLLCGARDLQDPSIAVVQRLQRDFPYCDIVLLVSSETIGSNYKVSTLHHLTRQAKYDVLVVSDSDVSVEPDYLHQIVPPLLDAQVGVVTCPYRGGATSPFPALLESLLINTGFVSMILVASQVEKTTYAFGATMAVKRETLEKIGGFAALADYLADDYYLGNLAFQAGYAVRIVPYVVETHPGVSGLRDLLRHQVRWARTQRTCRPGGYFGTLVTYGVVWALIGVLLFPSSIAMWQLALATLGLRLYSASIVSDVFLDAAVTHRFLWLVPLTDILSFVIWCLSLRGDTVHWGDDVFRVHRDGKMTQVEKEKDSFPNQSKRL